MGCEPEAITPNDAPTLLGFGEIEGSVFVTGEETAVNILWTQPTQADQELPFTLFGDGAGANDLEVISPNPLFIPAGTTEATIILKGAGTPDPERTERGGRIAIESAAYRLSTRDTFTFGFSVPHTVDVELWAPDLSFPKLWGYTSFNADPVPEGDGLFESGRHFCFSHASRTEPNVIGFYNTDEGRSTNALNLHRIYADYEVTSASGNIRIPELFRLTPASPGARSGTVEIIEQRIEIIRRASSGLPPFMVGLSGGGTYDEDTGSLTVGIFFDESELGVTDPVLRRYVYETQRR